jgi:hypothetical protein
LLRPTSSTTDATVTHPARAPFAWTIAAYVGIFALFFWGVHSGLGHYWDWSFPYFSDQLGNLFSNKSSSWIAENAGSPLGYSSDYFLRFFMAIFGFLPPELVRYLMLVGVFTATASGVYLLARRHTKPLLAFSVGLLAVINPAIFYKYTAGHINYLVAFAVFVFFVYFMLYKFDKNLRSAVITGLFIAAMGAQIQFFVISVFFLVVFFAFNRHLLHWKYFAPVLIVPLLVHAVWLSNFVTGAMSAAETSSVAAQASMKHASNSDFLSVFTFSFSKATLLSKFYAFYELLWHALLFIFLFWLLVRQRRQERQDTPTIILLVFLALMMFMATGLYQALNLGPITGLYPMLREVGHFAPVIVLAAVILIVRMVKVSRWRWVLAGVVFGSLVIVGVKFQFYSQAYNFADVRQKFTPFKTVADRDTGTYRILAYPFFGKYSFNHLPNDSNQLFPLKNNGHDSFATFAGQDFIKNAVAPPAFQESIQYKLLQDYDVDVLRPYNVKYIFDFSDIYESNYERYVPATVYNNDLSLIKNDPEFFEKLLSRNPGKLRQVNEHVLEVTDYMPRVQATGDMFSLDDTADAPQASSFTRRALDRPLDYTSDEKVTTHTTRLEPLFGDAEQTNIDYDAGTFNQTVPAGSKLYSNTSYAMVFYELAGDRLTLYADTPGNLLLNNEALRGNAEGRRPLMQLSVDAAKDYYISTGGTVLPLERDQLQQLGVANEGDKLEILTATSSNLVQNGSFEQKLWQETVGDCNNYDSHGAVKMQRTTKTAGKGKAALELGAIKHDACTSTTVKLAANEQYLLRFDYQSPNAQTANFFLSYGTDDARFAKGFRAITDDNWHTATQLITTPDQAGDARLFFYALEQDGKQETINRYDDVSLVRLEKAEQFVLPATENPYRQIATIGDAEQKLTFQATGYTYENLLANPSFEHGPWQHKVSDCNNYDSRPDIGMRLFSKGSKGDKSLELSARRHDACARTTANVGEDTDYLLTFDYQADGAKHYGYALSFDDPQAAVTREQFGAKAGQGWQRASFKVRTPARASALTLYLYAFEGGGKRNTVRYDNVQLVELPDFNDRFYAVQEPQQQLKTPENIQFAGGRPFRKDITVTGASTPFFLMLSETYNPKWRLELASARTNNVPARWLPNNDAGALKPFETSGYMNGWLVDPAKLCAQQNDSCKKQSDGTYDLRLVAEFAPQRWFGIAAMASWLTVFGSIVYLLLSGGRDSPTYQSIVRRINQQRKAKR